MKNTNQNNPIWLSPPHMGTAELQFIREAFDSNWITTQGANVNGFEDDLKNYLGGDTFVTALSSGTAAIHLGLILLGIKPGDEVICQSFTFAASANPVTYLGARPVFVDSEPGTWNISPELLEAAIQDRIALGRCPKAIIPVHLYGMPADMSAICDIARKYTIPVLEDAAEALGSSIDGTPCGKWGDMAVLSFNGNKIITTSGGGALVTKDSAIMEQARFLSTQARDPAPHYQHSVAGYNYRLSNICAGIGRGQMQVLEERIRQRRANFERYLDIMGTIPGIRFLHEPPGKVSNRWLTTCLIDPEENGKTASSLYQAFKENNIESRPLWKPMHLQPLYRDAPFYGDNTSEMLFASGICLPSGSAMGKEDWGRIGSVIKTWYEN